jgi:polar amino acid transport system substrate-binding protein
VAAAMFSVAALVLTGCGSDNTPEETTPGNAASSSSSAGGGVDEALAAKVPEAVKSKGTITIGSDATYAPSEFLDTDGKTVIGFDVDLFDAVAAKLGLKTDWTPAPFDAIITGVGSGKYDIGVSSFTINPERLKQADMISYFNAGTQWSTKKGNPSGITPDTACGKAVAVQRGTVQIDDIEARSKKCTDAGQPAIKVDQYQGQDQATAAIVSGKDDAGLADSPVMAYAVQQTKGQLELLGDVNDAAPYGYVIKKDQGEFGQALADALKALMEDGTYEQVLKKWGVEAGAIDNPEVKTAS